MPPNNAPIEEETSMRDDFDTAIAAVESDDDTAVTLSLIHISEPTRPY